MVGHLCVKFDNHSCNGFWDIVRKGRRTDNHINAAENVTPATTVGVGNDRQAHFVLDIYSSECSLPRTSLSTEGESSSSVIVPPRSVMTY